MALLKQGERVLLAGASLGDLSRVRSALECGADVNATSDGDSALHKAAGNGHLAACELLIASGANVNHAVQEGYGASPLHMAALCDHPDRSRILRLLLVNGASVNASLLSPNTTQGTPLQFCVAKQQGVAEAVDVLLEFGADPNAVDKVNRTVLHAATGPFDWQFEVVRQLVQAGADPAYVPPGAEATYLTPFQDAVSMGWASIVEYYVTECSQDLEQVTIDGRSLIQLVENDPEALGVLLSIQSEQRIRGACLIAGESEKLVSPRGVAAPAPL